MLNAGSRASLAWRVFFAALTYATVTDGGAAVAEDISAPLKQAQVALSAGDYAVAYPLFKKQAEAGNPLASFTVALFHEYGWGRPVDRAIACVWFEQSAGGKIPAGEHFAGDCLRRGANGPPDPTAAAHMYERAAAHGHLISLCSLAELYVTGEGMPKDVAKGLALCQQAAQKGIATAQVRLARFLLDGVTGIPEYLQALQILQVAAEADNPEAQFLLARILRDGLGTKANIDLAVGWSERAASKGYLPAYLPTAQMYYGAARDPRTGLLPPEFLAKSYLWTSALIRRSEDSADLADAKRLLVEVRKEMPPTWALDLDRKVDEHIAGLATPPVVAR